MRRMCAKLRIHQAEPREAAFHLRVYVPFLVALAWLGYLPHWLLLGVLNGIQIEMLNYIWHYGLEGCEIHSWDDPSLSGMENWNTNAHAAHHDKPAMPFATLRIAAEPSPNHFPLDFLLMMGLTLFPPLFRGTMDPLVYKLWAHLDGSKVYAVTTSPKQRSLSAQRGG